MTPINKVYPQRFQYKNNNFHYHGYNTRSQYIKTSIEIKSEVSHLDITNKVLPEIQVKNNLTEFLNQNLEVETPQSSEVGARFSEQHSNDYLGECIHFLVPDNDNISMEIKNIIESMQCFEGFPEAAQSIKGLDNLTDNERKSQIRNAGDNYWRHIFKDQIGYDPDNRTVEGFNSTYELK